MKNTLILLILSLFVALSAQTVTIIAPNGGETFAHDSITTISWTKTGFTENVKIELYKNGLLHSVIAPSIMGTSYDWTIPTTISGSDYKIKILSVNAAFISDYSDNNFTIAGGFIEINTPNGGETLQRGQSYNITWMDDLSENVKIELYQGGVLKSLIGESVPSNGSYNWIIPINISGSNFKIKISSVQTSTVCDLSNIDFSISAGTISLISPNGGDVFGLGKTYEIKWSNSISSDGVKIELLKNGSFVRTISKNAGSTGSYKWSIPYNLQISTKYKIKITSLNIPAVNYQSATNFTVSGTIINGGNVSGLFQRANSPYVITASATVPTGSSLDIQPGADLVLKESLIINGTLRITGDQDTVTNIFGSAPITVTSGLVQLKNCIFNNNDKTWKKKFSGMVSSDGLKTCIVRTTDGGYVMSGNKKSSGISEIWVVKLDCNGYIIWEKTFNSTYYNYVENIIQTSDGGYALAGHTRVIKLDADGNIIWDKTINSPTKGVIYLYSVIQTSDGGYALTGHTSWTEDVCVVKLDANGNIIWVKTFNGYADKNDRAYSIIQTTDGGYAVVGYMGRLSASLSNVTDIWVLKLNSSGNLIWNNNFSVDGGGYNACAYSIIQTSDGGYAVAGTSYNYSSKDDIRVLKLLPNGEKYFDVSLNGSANGNDGAYSIVQTADGGFAVAGYTTTSSGKSDFWVIRQGANGNKIWEQTFDDTANNNDRAYSILETEDGCFVIAGTTINSTSDADAWVLKLDDCGKLSTDKDIIMQNATPGSSLANCLFANNNNNAVYLATSSPAITNCTFSKNTAEQGGAIYACGISTPKITNSIFWGNNATTGKQIYLDGTVAKPEFRYNLIDGGYLAIGLGNSAVLGEVWESNLTTNPIFIDTINFQLPANSPAINAGTPDVASLNLPTHDLWGNTRVYGGRIDIGVFEYAPSAINTNLINDWNLSQNYPNPFNPQTTINYTIKDGFSGLVKLKIYNAKGEVIQTITNIVARAGHYSQVFNGSRFSSGIYYYGIEAGDFKQMKKMVMVK